MELSWNKSTCVDPIYVKIELKLLGFSDKVSDTLEIKRGVSQGSQLGSLLLI